ncbi:DUF1499 domain-containing protein [Minwuia thermotolerans]|uniref:DUF1499 domain-containing protein n=1 Tax=Minwuia thermotolerans TaxID=2056226 RepID=UPI0013DE203A|nr:DUF1499 domain-containing protein [Minwuia thermotolerans]
MIDFATFELNRKPNQFLLAPDGLCQNATPHERAPSFDLPADMLINRFRTVALAEPRVRVLEDERRRGQMVFVQKSKVFRFPDHVDVLAIEMPEGRSTIAVYSRSRLGYRDFGVNRRRVHDWLAKLEN